MCDYLDKFYYSKDDLGVTYLNDSFHLKYGLPTSIKVELLLFEDWYISHEDDVTKYQMTYDYKNGVYSTVIKEDADGLYYLGNLF